MCPGLYILLQTYFNQLLFVYACYQFPEATDLSLQTCYFKEHSCKSVICNSIWKMWSVMTLFMSFHKERKKPVFNTLWRIEPCLSFTTEGSMCQYLKGKTSPYLDLSVACPLTARWRLQMAVDGCGSWFETLFHVCTLGVSTCQLKKSQWLKFKLWHEIQYYLVWTCK